MKEEVLECKWPNQLLRKKYIVSIKTDTDTPILQILHHVNGSIITQIKLQEMSFQHHTGSVREYYMKISSHGIDQFTIYFPNIQSFCKWKELFMTLNVNKLEPVFKKSRAFTSFSSSTAASASVSSGSRLETVAPQNWTVDDVQDWLKLLRTPGVMNAEVASVNRMFDVVGNIFLKNKITGSQLLQLDETKLSNSLQIKELAVATKLDEEIKKLKIDPTFSLSEHLVRSKFEKLDLKFANQMDMEKQIKTLCNVEKIKEVYLNPNKLDRLVVQKYKELDTNDKNCFEIDSRMDQYEEVRLRVKLVITEIAHSDIKKDIRKFFAPLFGAISLAPNFGAFHTALIVGPVLFPAFFLKIPFYLSLYVVVFGMER